MARVGSKGGETRELEGWFVSLCGMVVLGKKGQRGGLTPYLLIKGDGGLGWYLG